MGTLTSETTDRAHLGERLARIARGIREANCHDASFESTGVDFSQTASYPLQVKLMMDLIAAAVKCDLARAIRLRPENDDRDLVLQPGREARRPACSKPRRGIHVARQFGDPRE
jgi:hypothetical protein